MAIVLIALLFSAPLEKQRVLHIIICAAAVVVLVALMTHILF